MYFGLKTNWYIGMLMIMGFQNYYQKLGRFGEAKRIIKKFTNIKIGKILKTKRAFQY